MHKKIIITDNVFGKEIIRDICLTTITERKDLILISVGNLQTYLVSDAEAKKYKIGDKYSASIIEKVKRLITSK